MNDRYEVGYVDPNGQLELLGFRNTKTEARSTAREYARENGQGWVGDRYAHRRKPCVWIVNPTGEPKALTYKIVT
jgi:hypothetical protein